MNTPGPWEALKNTPVVLDGSDNIVADCGSRNAKCYETAMHNARLIAAAPDMLAALENTLSWLTSYRGGGAMGGVAVVVVVGGLTQYCQRLINTPARVEGREAMTKWEWRYHD